MAQTHGRYQKGRRGSTVLEQFKFYDSRCHFSNNSVNEDENSGHEGRRLKSAPALPNHAAISYFSGVKYFTALLGLIFAFALPLAHAQQSPDEQYLAVYNLIQKADEFQAAGRARLALDNYSQALAGLQKFQKAFPDWETKIVTYRLGYLTEKVNSLTARFAADTPIGTMTNAAARSTPPATDAVSAVPVTDAEAQLSVLRAQMEGLQAENELLRAKLKEALSLQPAAVDTQELAAAQAQVLSLMKEKDLLLASLANGVANNVAPPVESSQSRQALADANKKLAAETGRADKLAEENKKLQSDAGISALEKAALEKRLKQRQAPAASAPPKISGEVKTLRARLAVAEAKAVPYTPEELAVLKSPPPAPVAKAAGRGKSAGKLPTAAAALVAEAQGCFSTGDYGKAEADYLKILQLAPDNALALANLAAVELQEDKLADAETHITAALAQDPEDAFNLSTFGFLKYRQQKFDEALDALSRAAKLDPANPQIQNYLGVTLSHKGLRAQAEAALRKAIELAPNYGAAHNNLAVIYLGEQPPLAALARWHYLKALQFGESHNADLEKMLADLGVPVNQE
jgi:cytochrome c-type biogenesis protein CcmH/NrfG